MFKEGSRKQNTVHTFSHDTSLAKHLDYQFNKYFTKRITKEIQF